MRSVPRTAALLLVPALLIGWNWGRIELPPHHGWQIAWVALLGCLPALAPRLWQRLAAAVVAFLLAAHSAFAVSIFDARPFDAEHDFFGPLFSRFGNGFLDFYDVRLPFDEQSHVLMHGVVLLAVFAGCLAVALAIAARRAGLAVFGLLVAAGWPATLLPGPGDLTRGALLLAGLLVLLAGVRAGGSRSAGHALAFGAVIVLAALGASTSSAVSKREFLTWQRWDFYTRPEKPVGVNYVWDSNYNGIRFPKKVTTVFRVHGPQTSYYWRATTLDAVSDGHWVQDLTSVTPHGVGGRDVLTEDPFLPARARLGSSWVKEEVTIAALADSHLVAPSRPVAYDRGNIEKVEYANDGIALAPFGLARDQRYTVWSYAPTPTPTQLARSEPVYPRDVSFREKYLEVARGRSVPLFGSNGRSAFMESLFRYDVRVQAYEPLYRTAMRIVGQPKNPYAAAVGLEAWFRTNPKFEYDERPPIPVGAPPLVSFVVQTHKGYCQYYAGAMALMLRYLGIPARVAAGFTSGRYDLASHTWTVTDHNAHTWVEVWFRGYGWLPFDPTPARGALSATYTSASARFDVNAAARVIGKLTGFDIKQDAGFGFESGSRGALAPFASEISQRGGGAGSDESGRNRGIDLLRLLGLLAAGLVVLIAGAKLARRRARFLTRDPRRLAAACRRDLADFLVDQGMGVSSSATLTEIAELVHRELGVNAHGFVEAVAAARFGPPAQAREHARSARRELRQLRTRIRAALSRPDRALGLLSVRSLGFGAP